MTQQNRRTTGAGTKDETPTTKATAGDTTKTDSQDRAASSGGSTPEANTRGASVPTADTVGDATPTEGATAGQHPLRKDAALTGSGDAGPGTGRVAPDEDTQRSAARQVVRTTAAASPLEAPDHETQVTPAEGYESSSTNPMADLVGFFTTAGENHVRFERADGTEVTDVKALFDDPGEHSTVLRAKERIIEVFRTPGAKQAGRRVWKNPGSQLSRGQFLALDTFLERAQAQNAQLEERFPG